MESYHKLFPNKLLVALGGNAIHPEGIKGTGEEQFGFAREASKALLPLLQNIPELVLTHGNGPGVGKVLMRQAIAHLEDAYKALCGTAGTQIIL